MASERDVAASLEARVLEEFRRSGFVPPELTRHIQAAAARRSGSIVTAEQVERYCREWMEAKLAADAKQAPQARPGGDSDEKIEQAVATLTGFSPRKRPKEWAEALAVVQQASREGRLTRAQVAQIDALDAVYAAKAG